MNDRATDAAETIRAKVRSGALPLPADPPAKCWVGEGIGRACDGCDKVLAPDEIEYELDISDGRTLRLHADCLALWHTARAEQMTEPAQLLAGLHILVVDDHEDIRDMLQQAFAFLGADVTTVVSAEDAIPRVASADVVVTDFALKGNDGAWLLGQINSSPRPIPVVLLSGFVETQIGAMAGAPFALKLLKPVDPIDLATKIRALLDVPAH
jgi:CheY-like chemotaxis protein